MAGETAEEELQRLRSENEELKGHVKALIQSNGEKDAELDELESNLESALESIKTFHGQQKQVRRSRSRIETQSGDRGGVGDGTVVPELKQTHASRLLFTLPSSSLLLLQLFDEFVALREKYDSAKRNISEVLWEFLPRETVRLVLVLLLVLVLVPLPLPSPSS